MFTFRRVLGHARSPRCAFRAARASCVLRNAPESKHTAAPTMSGLLRITGRKNMVRFARLERASCCGMRSEGNPSGPFVLGLLGLGLRRRMVRFARFGWGLSRRRVRRFRACAFSTGVEMCWAFGALLRPAPLASGRGLFGSRPFFVPLKCERSVNGLVGGWLLSVSGVSFQRFI